MNLLNKMSEETFYLCLISFPILMYLLLVDWVIKNNYSKILLVFYGLFILNYYYFLITKRK